MKFADQLRSTKQKNYTINGTTVYGEQSIAEAMAAEKAVEIFKQYAQELASVGKTECKILIGGYSVFYLSGGKLGIGYPYGFSFSSLSSAMTVCKYIRESLKDEGLNSLSIKPSREPDPDIRRYWGIRIGASW